MSGKEFAIRLGIIIIISITISIFMYLVIKQVGGRIVMEEEKEYATLKAENKRLEAELDKHRIAVTMVACEGGCGKGVQNRHSVNGMCPDCAEAEIERLYKALRKIIRVRNGGTYQSHRVKEMKKIAKEALDGKCTGRNLTRR